MQENERIIQLSQENNKSHLQTSDNSLHGEADEILTEDTSLQKEQRRTFMAAVDQMRDATIEFGTVMVFTCSKSCWTEIESATGKGTYFEEYCLVEADPDTTFFQ